MTTANAKIVLTADDKTKAAFASVQKNLNGLKSLAGSVGLGAAFSVAGLVAFTKESIDALDNLNDLSKRTNVAVEDLAGLDLAARSSGTSLESLATSFNKLSINIGKNREEYAKLGITATDPLEAFKQLADVFNSIQNPQEQAAFGAKAFGKAYAEIVPLLKEGGDNIGRLVTRGKELSGINTELAEKADKVNDELEILKVRASGAALVIAGPLISGLSNLIDKYNDLLTVQSNLESSNPFANFFSEKQFDKSSIDKDLADTQARLISLRKTYDALDPKANVANKINDFVFGDRSDLKLQIDIAEIELKRLRDLKKRATEISKPISAPNKNIAPTQNAIKSFIGNDGSESTKKAKQEIDKVIESLNELKAKSEEAGRSGQALELYKLSTLGASNAQLNLASNLLTSIEAQEKQANLLEKGAELTQKFQSPLDAYTAAQTQLNELLSKGVITQDVYNGALAESIDTYVRTDEATRKAIESAAELNAILSQTPTEQLEKTREQMVLLYEAFAQGKINAEQLGEGVKVVLGQTSDKLVETEDEFAEFGKQAARNIQDSFADFLFDPFAEGLDGMLEGFAKTVQRMVAEAAAAKIAKNLFGDLAGGTGGGFLGDIFGGFFTGLFTNADGNAFDRNGLVAFANGGVVNSPTLFKFGNGKNGVMGEAGTEGIFPLKRGPNGQLGVQAFGGSQTSAAPINVVMNISTPDANSFNKSKGQIIADVSRSLSAARRFS